MIKNISKIEEKKVKEPAKIKQPTKDSIVPKLIESKNIANINKQANKEIVKKEEIETSVQEKHQTEKIEEFVHVTEINKKIVQKYVNNKFYKIYEDKIEEKKLKSFRDEK